MRSLGLAATSSALLALGTAPSKAAEISVEVSDLGRLLYPTLVVRLTGEITEGDADRLEAAVEANLHEKQRGLFFAFDSPGGSLLEGVRIGRFIASRPELTTALVGTPDAPEAICASACVFAYLGADTREKTPEAMVGLHQVSLAANTLDGAEALGLGQQVSAVVTSYLADRGASAEIFDRMVLTGPEGIDWVSDQDLAELGIVGGGVILSVVR